jgi:hypothetical protein
MKGGFAARLLELQRGIFGCFIFGWSDLANREKSEPRMWHRRTIRDLFLGDRWHA